MKERTQYNLIIVCIFLVIVGLSYWTYVEALKPEMCATSPLELEDMIRIGSWLCVIVSLMYITMKRAGADDDESG